MNFDQMRDLLLEQAFQGNLVPQLKEEPTIEPDSKVSGDVPFEIPKKWKWATLDDCVVFNPKIQSDDDADVSFIPMQACEAGYVNKLNVTDVRKWKTVKKGFSKFQDQDVLMAKITPCFQNRKSAIAENLKGGIGAGTTEFHVLRCNKNLLPKYLLFFLKSSYLIRYGIGNFKGTAGQQRIGTSELKNCAVPIPSLNEQRRIVAKLEESFAEIDRAEKAYRELQTLAGVLRGKILQEAVMGKLVPQLDGEPAVEQLGETPEIIPFEIPQKWKWVRFESTCSSLDGKRVPVKKSDREKQARNFPYYGATGIIDYVENYIFDGTYLLIGEDGANLLSKAKDNAFMVSGKFWLNNHAHIFESNEVAELSYLRLVINSMSLNPYVTGSAQPKLTQKKLLSIPVPLPPLTEQRRIVAKVEELMAQVDRLAN